MTEPTKTLYVHEGSDAVDESVWPPAGTTTDGRPTYTFVGDTEPGDAKGVSSEWVVYDPDPASTVVETPTDTAVVTPVVDEPVTPFPNGPSGTNVTDPAPDTLGGDTSAEPAPAPGPDDTTTTLPSGSAPDPVAPATPADPPAQQILPDGPRGTDQTPPTEQGTGDTEQPGASTSVLATNNGSPDTSTSNEGDQPPAYVPPPAGPGAPDAPVITSPEADSTLSGTIVITGTGSNGDLVYLYEGEGLFPVNPATVQDGGFKFVISLEPGEHSLSVRQRNAAGDTSDPSEDLVVHVEAVPEQPPVDSPDERFAHFLRFTLLDDSSRLSWDLYAVLRSYAEEWLDSKNL